MHISLKEFDAAITNDHSGHYLVKQKNAYAHCQTKTGHQVEAIPSLQLFEKCVPAEDWMRREKGTAVLLGF